MKYLLVLSLIVAVTWAAWTPATLKAKIEAIKKECEKAVAKLKATSAESVLLENLIHGMDALEKKVDDEKNNPIMLEALGELLTVIDEEVKAELKKLNIPVQESYKPGCQLVCHTGANGQENYKAGCEVKCHVG